MENASWELVLVPVLSLYSFIHIHPYYPSRPGKHPSSEPNRTPAQTDSRPGETPTNRTEPRSYTVWLQGFGSFPNSLPNKLWENPLHDVLVFPGIHVSTVPLNPARAGIPFTYGWFQPTFRTLALNVCGLPAQAHNSGYDHHRPLALLPMWLVNIIFFGITLLTLCRLLTYKITQFPDYLAVPPDKHTTTLYLYKARLLLLRVHVRLNHYTCHRRRPPPVRRQSPTMIRKVATATSDHCLWPLSTIHKPNYNNRIYISHHPIATLLLLLHTDSYKHTDLCWWIHTNIPICADECHLIDLIEKQQTMPIFLMRCLVI